MLAVVQKLNSVDSEFVKYFLQLIDDGNILQSVIMFNEAHFELSANINTQNCHYRSRVNPINYPCK